MDQILALAKATSPGFLKSLGITTRFAFPVSLKHLGGFERMLNNPINADANLKRQEEFILELVAREAVILHHSLIAGRERALQKQLDALEGAATSLAFTLTGDDFVRDGIREFSQQIMASVKAGQFSWLQAETIALSAMDPVLHEVRQLAAEVGLETVEGLVEPPEAERQRRSNKEKKGDLLKKPRRSNKGKKGNLRKPPKLRGTITPPPPPPPTAREKFKKKMQDFMRKRRKLKKMDAQNIPRPA